MDDTDTASRLEVLHEAAGTGAEMAMDAFRSDLTVEEKAGPMDAVTEIDRAVQRRVAELVAEEYPDDALVGEEEDALKEIPDSGDAWVVDPIDGTNNYVVGNRTWCVSVAAVRDGEPVAAVNHLPATGDVVAAGAGGTVRNGDPASVSDRDELGSFMVNPIFGLGREDRRELVDVVDTIMHECGDMRRIGSAQAVLSAVACGELDAAVSTVSLAPWDTVAGVHHIRQAGGTVTDLSGEPWEPGAEGLLASNGRAHRELLDAFGN